MTISGGLQVQANVNAFQTTQSGGPTLVALVYAVPANSYAIVRVTTTVTAGTGGYGRVFLNTTNSQTNTMQIANSVTTTVVTTEVLYLGPGMGVYNASEANATGAIVATNVVGVEFKNIA